MSLIPFILASLIGRGGRFYLVAGVLVLGGEKLEHLLHKYMDWMAWFVIFAAGLFFVLR
jgi:membrane protein YqaA with SNARE-associated domain